MIETVLLSEVTLGCPYAHGLVSGPAGLAIDDISMEGVDNGNWNDGVAEIVTATWGVR